MNQKIAAAYYLWNLCRTILIPGIILGLLFSGIDILLKIIFSVTLIYFVDQFCVLVETSTDRIFVAVASLFCKKRKVVTTFINCKNRLAR